MRAWHARNDGSGVHNWFVVLEETDGTVIGYLEGAKGLRRFGRDGAKREAARLNALEQKSLPAPQITLDTEPDLDYFSQCSTVAEVKARFKELAKTLHPDVGGSAEAFRALVAARDAWDEENDDTDDYCEMMGMTEWK